MPVEIQQTSWQNCLEILEKEVQPQSYNTWLKPTELIDEAADSLTIGVPNRFVAGWLESHYLVHLNGAIEEVYGGPRKLKFIVNSEKLSSNAPLVIKPVQKQIDYQTETSLNKKYTFDNFVVGDSNQFAHAAALAVAEAPAGNKFNPLYIYGGVGLGKTHLAQAIGNFVVQTNSNLKVLYVTSEKFTNDFIDAIAAHKTTNFTGLYRNIDLLIIDDIQFLSGKEATQAQFFHTFNSLYQSSRQIVLTSDRPPKEIYGLEERLLSRFQCGLVTDIQPPSLEMRLAILKKKIEMENLQVPDDVIACIANRLKSNVREMEGLLIRLGAQNSLTGSEITCELVNELLGTSQPTATKEITLDKISYAVSEYFKLPIEQIKGKSKTLEVTIARQICMYLARKFTTYSLKMVGKFYGGRDHSTVIHSIKKITQDMGHDSLLRFRVDEIINSMHVE